MKKKTGIAKEQFLLYPKWYVSNINQQAIWTKIFLIPCQQALYLFSLWKELMGLQA